MDWRLACRREVGLTLNRQVAIKEDSVLFFRDENAFESEKERNFYSKVFAGFLFNELVAGYDKRVSGFLALLDSARFKGPHAPPIPKGRHGPMRVSFDNHGYLLVGPGADRGEFADILVQDRARKLLIAIEVKFLSGWEYPKDIEKNGQRLERIAHILGDVTVIPVLLVTKKKWEACHAQSGRSASHFTQLQNDTNARVRVIWWEDLLPLANSVPQVQSYINAMLKETRQSMTLATANNWFHRQHPLTLD